MNGIDIAVIVIVSVAVLGVIGWLVYKKVKHKSIGCDCGYGCNGCTMCDKGKKEDK
ncbi:MAG TPA: FeoB-associated Cys-rich membrane protein [Clostridiales bacterium]|nr:FeoB-associated Cys-rich membrane protein [Clostridiales bacterium]